MPVAAALASWLGGLAFYATLVVPAGAEVLGSHAAFGMVTRVVAHGINLWGAAVIAIVVIDLALRSRSAVPRLEWACAAIMLGAQAALFFLRPWLDALLDPAHGRVLDESAFYQRHRIYLLVTAAEWLAGAFLFVRRMREPAAANGAGQPASLTSLVANRRESW